VAVAAATLAERADDFGTAVTLYARAFGWDSSNKAAEGGMQQLAVTAKQEQEVASQLLTAAVGADTEAAGRAMKALGLLGIHTTSANSLML